MDKRYWLNKEYGESYWICNGLLKPCNEEICKVYENFMIRKEE